MITATVLTDGSSDAVLLPILRWLLRVVTPGRIELSWADLWGLGSETASLRRRIELAIEHYPCSLLFVHRDAESRNPAPRFAEIEQSNASRIRHVCVVPVRAQETWLLCDEMALRVAAGRPSSRIPLGLPALRRLESVADPKRVLHDALRRASGAKGRRAKRFSPHRVAHRLADLVRDWSPLRELAAFRRLETDTRSALAELGYPLNA